MRRPRSAGGKLATTANIDKLIKPPPPRPGSARTATSAGMLNARAQASEPSVNSPEASSSIGRRPQRSASLPYSGTAAVAAIR